MNRARPTLLSVFLLVCLPGCSGSEEVKIIQAACDSSGKYEMKMCLCIAEGAAKTEMSGMVREWLLAQLSSPADSPITIGIAPTLKMIDYLKYMDRISDPRLFCSDRKTE